MDIGRLEGTTGLAGLRAGIGDTALGEGLLADVVGKGALVFGYVWGLTAVVAGASEAERGLEKGVLLTEAARRCWGLDNGLGLGE